MCRSVVAADGRRDVRAGSCVWYLPLGPSRGIGDKRAYSAKPRDLEADPRVVLPTPPPPSPGPPRPPAPHHRTACQARSRHPSPPIPRQQPQRAAVCPRACDLGLLYHPRYDDYHHERWHRVHPAMATAAGGCRSFSRSPSDARQPHYGAPAPRGPAASAARGPSPSAASAAWFRRHDVCPAPSSSASHGPF